MCLLDVIATLPPQYSALPVQPLRISGVGVPLPLSPDQVDNNESPNVDADDDDDNVKRVK